MPNMNSYTYMLNHKVLNDKPNETGINSCNCSCKDTCPLPNSCQTKCIIYQANMTVTSLDINKIVTLAHEKHRLKIVSGIIKSCSATLHKNDTGLSKESWEIKKCNGAQKIA